MLYVTTFNIKISYLIFWGSVSHCRGLHFMLIYTIKWPKVPFNYFIGFRSL